MRGCRGLAAIEVATRRPSSSSIRHRRPPGIGAIQREVADAAFADDALEAACRLASAPSQSDDAPRAMARSRRPRIEPGAEAPLKHVPRCRSDRAARVPCRPCPETPSAETAHNRNAATGRQRSGRRNQGRAARLAVEARACRAVLKLASQRLLWIPASAAGGAGLPGTAVAARRSTSRSRISQGRPQLARDTRDTGGGLRRATDMRVEQIRGERPIPSRDQASASAAHPPDNRTHGHSRGRLD